MRIPIIFAIFFISTFLVGCASDGGRRTDGVRVNMDKAQVLETAGAPKYTYREDNQDNWVYSWVNGDREWAKVITFDSGRVVKISRPVPKDSASKELQNTKSMEEYERKARELQKRQQKFKDIGD